MMKNGLLKGILVTMLWSMAQWSMAQETYTMKGKVTSGEDGEQMPGVTILVKGKATGTVTDLDGNYRLEVTENDILVFSFLGFATQEVPTKGKTQIDVELPLDISSLEDVVIVGYGEMDKANLTGAVVTVETKDLDEIPTGNLALALDGKMAGVQVNRNGTGIPGTSSPLVIRNETASSLQRQVLYVIDGVIYSDNDYHDVPGPSGSSVFNNLDPSEIESISILKDGAAAVYGARAAGGVVLVKTKRGQAGKIKLTYNGSMGIGQPTRLPEMLTGIQHAELWNEILDIKKANGDRIQSSDYFDSTDLAYIRDKDYNWLDEIYENAFNQRHSFTLSGGSDKARYFFGGTHYDEKGHFDGLWYKRYTVRTNLDFDVSQSVKLAIGLYVSQTNSRKTEYDGDEQPGVMRSMYRTPLTAPRWVPIQVDGNPVDFGSFNPLGLLESDNYKKGSGQNSNINTKLEYNAPFLQGLKFSAFASYNLSGGNGQTFNQDYAVTEYFKDNGIDPSDSSTTYKPNGDISFSESFSKATVYQLNLSTNYTRSFGKHNVTGILVYEQQEGKSRSLSSKKIGSNFRGLDYMWAFDQLGSINGNYNQSGRWSLIGRFNYDYNGKYLLESSFRAEESNRFHPDERLGIFPSFSTGWVISEESFFRNNVGFINFLKIRGSFGITGNDGNSKPSEWKPTFSAGLDPSGPILGKDEYRTNTISANNGGFYVPSRTWAKVRNYNAGIDISILNQKLDLTAEYYYSYYYDAFDRNSTYPLLVGNDKPPLVNYKESFSKGVEFQLDYSDVKGNFNYNTYANFSTRDSRPTKLYQNERVLGQWDDQRNVPDSHQPGYIALGIIRDEEHLEEVKKMYPGNTNDDGDVIIDNIPLAPGMLYYKDVGGPNYSGPDGKLGGDDRRVIAKYTTAPYSYGFGFSIGYKAFKINTSFGGEFGHKVAIAKEEQVVNRDSKLVVTQTQNTFAWWGDYWTEDNKDAKFPRPALYGKQGEHSTFWMRNGHTLRLTQMSVSYQMPKVVNNQLGVSNLKFYVSSTNVWTIISPYTYKDPAQYRAFDYPLVRMINMGLSFSI